MAKKKEETTQEPATEAAPEPAAEIGLKESNPLAVKVADGWTLGDDGLYRNNATFNVNGGVVPQGCCRTLEEAHALEVRRIEHR